MESLVTDTTSVLTLVKSCMTLFGEFPLNLILVGSLAGVAFMIFRRARGAAN